MPQLTAKAVAFAIATASLVAAEGQIGDDYSSVFDESTIECLNKTVDYRLRVGKPWALPCYSKYKTSFMGTVDNRSSKQVCDRIGEDMSLSTELIKEFGSYHNPSFATCMSREEKCTVSQEELGSNFRGASQDICYQGTVPSFYIDARNAEDVKKGVELAAKFKVPITVKNTGHDYKGRSTGVNTLAIWTHNIQPDLDISEDFTPEDCDESAGPAVTYGAGQTSRDLYEKLDGSGYFSVGGSCTTVGVAGGWLAGGGHSIVSPTFGLGVDNALQVKVVLPDGKFVTANRCKNKDIFFAVRGGGGGTFGVVTEVTAKLHKDREFTYAFVAMEVPDDPQRVNEIIVENAAKWADEGWGGLYGVDVNTSTTFLGFTPQLSVEEAEKSLKPLTDYFESMSSDSASFISNITSLPNHWAAQNTDELLGFLSTEAGVTLTRASRLVPRSNFESEKGRKELVDVLVKQPWASVLGAPTAFDLPESDKAGGPGESSVTPVWRDALWHYTYTTVWDQSDPDATKPGELAKEFKKMSKSMDAMRDITPKGAAYQNEGDVYEPNPIASFWGQDNYDRLLKIKEDLDPDNLMSCWTCVGWDKKDSRHKCYPDVDKYSHDSS